MGGGGCVNRRYLLTKKVDECESRGKLKSVAPQHFRPRQASLTFFGVQGQMGVSWVTYDGRQVVGWGLGVGWGDGLKSE